MKSIALIIFLILSCKIGYSQDFHGNFNTYENLRRYWYYRERLRDFIWRSPNSNLENDDWSAHRGEKHFFHDGSYLPAKRYFIDQSNGDELIDWGDAGEHMGYYLQTLATEYRLLKDYGQSIVTVRNELSNALYALERLDMFNEHAYRRRGGCGEFDHLRVKDVNGFLVRDDVTDSIKIKNNEWNDIEDISSEFGTLEDKDLMSQDHIWHILVGLALVHELVDDPTQYESLTGADNTMSDWALTIGESLIQCMHGFKYFDSWINHCECNYIHWDPPMPAWLIRNPYNCSIAEKSTMEDVTPYSRYFEKAGIFFSGSPMIWPNSLAIPLDYKIDRVMMACGKISLMTIADQFLSNQLVWVPLTFNMFIQIIYDYIKRAWREDYGDAEYGYEHTPLVNWLLHEESTPIYDYKPSGAEMGFFERIVELLNTAPDCGPFYYGDVDQVIDCSSIDWATQNRLSKPHRTHRAGLEEEQQLGYYNGLDYLALHNLYWLTVIDQHISNARQTMTYPTIFGHGSDSNPAFVSATNKIISSNLIQSDGNVTYEAAKIALNPGFKVKSGGRFKANTSGGSILDHTRFKYVSFSPNCTNWPPPPTKSKTIAPEEFSDYREPNIFDYMENRSTGDDDLAGSAEEITIFPNPTTGQLTIKNLPVNKGTIHISLTNSIGEVFYSGTANNTSTSLDLSHIKNGYYLLQMNWGDNAVHEVRNVVVQR